MNGKEVLTIVPHPRGPTGGVEEYAYSVVDLLREKGYAVRVVTPFAGGYAKERGVEVVSDPQTTILPAVEMMDQRLISLNPGAYLRMLPLVKRADVVHVHMPFPFVEAVAALWAKLCGKPLIATYHMDAILEEHGGQEKGLKAKAIESAYRRLSAFPTLGCARIILSSSQAYTEQSPVLSLYAEKVRPLHQGIDPVKFGQLSEAGGRELRAKLLGDQYDRIVLFVGRLVPYKGLSYLIQAAQVLSDSRTLFVIGGKGEEEQPLRTMVRKLGLTNVSFLGFVPDADLMNLFYAADVFVSPSISMLEATPITLLYAKSMGTLVVGTEVGGTAESVPTDGKAGIVIPAKDVTALVGALRSLLSTPFHKARADPPRYWSSVAEDYAALLTQVTGGASSPSSPTPALTEA